MLVTPTGIYDICSTFHLTPSRISAMVHTSAVLPSHRRSCCGVQGPIPRADVYQIRENKPGDWRAYRPTLNISPSGSSRSVFVLTLPWQLTKKAAKYGNYTDIIVSGFWQSCGSIHTHWHTSLTHYTTSWMDKLSLKRKYMCRMLWKSDRTL